MKTIHLVANGDSRLVANQTCEAAQAAMERRVVSAVERFDARVKRAHEFDPAKGHGFIDSQKRGIEVFRSLPPEAPLIVAEAVWQYSYHVLPGLFTHQGPILTIANWSGEFPGLVGLLNLNASLSKAGVKYSTLWSENFDDEFFMQGLQGWLKTGHVTHDFSHVRAYRENDAPREAIEIGIRFAQDFRKEKAIMGVFDEGCMGMYNAIIPDELLHPTGVFKERLSQSALYAKMLTVTDEEAQGIFDWLMNRGMTFKFGEREATELTPEQVLQQCKMYIAAVRLADQYGCDTIGIQYQLGLTNLVAASDLAEGLLNNVERPPVRHTESGLELFAGEALPHFNEVDECSGLDGLITYHLWRQLGFAPETTLHDLRWGRHFKGEGVDDYVWVLEISGAAPPAHFIGGYGGATSERQPPMYFQSGGGSLKGVSRPGEIVWSRVYVEDNRLKCDLGLGKVVALPQAETDDRWRLTTPQWPIMHAVLHGVTRNQMMARHKSNHIQVIYAPDAANARRGLYAKAAVLSELGLEVCLCGDV
ncbi:MAG: fucose isomerase [Pyrinomonadaceae bacterium]|nr:fucose isomerase [Pyrinomonadaceae bacterium]